jgi:hypothetical protein
MPADPVDRPRSRCNTQAIPGVLLNGRDLAGMSAADLALTPHTGGSGRRFTPAARAR